jgi:hypothetical protein
MTIQEAFAEFTESADFKEIAKKKTALGNKYRVYLMRFKNEELKAGAIVELLLANGYQVKANKVTKRR